MKQNKGWLKVNDRSAILVVTRAGVVGRSEFLDLQRRMESWSFPLHDFHTRSLELSTDFRNCHSVFDHQVTCLLFVKRKQMIRPFSTLTSDAEI